MGVLADVTVHAARPPSVGDRRAVCWRDYPGVAGTNPQEALEWPTPQQGHDAGQAMIAGIRAALSEEFLLERAPWPTRQRPGGAASRSQHTRCRSRGTGSQGSPQYTLLLAGCLIYRAPFGGWEFGLRRGSGLAAAVAMET